MADGEAPRSTLLQHLRAIAALPLIVTVVIPAVLLVTGKVSIEWSLPAPWRVIPPAAGALLVVAGLALIVMTISLFTRVGRGTLAPWNPTQRLGRARHLPARAQSDDRWHPDPAAG